MFSLRDSEYGEFLYAPIGVEENGMVVTTLSAFARIGLDPWHEADRLARLPKDAASERLTSIISGLPNGSWAKSDAGHITAGLIALLPTPKSGRGPSRATMSGYFPFSFRVAAIAFLILLNGAVFVALRSRETSPAIDPGYGAASSAPSPSLSR